MISIILPNYNHAEYLEKRLKSIFNQTYQNFEVIILDDCSTDTSVDLLNTYKNHPKVSHFIVNDTNSGSPFKQWEKGLALAKGKYIWIAESDDYCDLDFVKKQIEILNEQTASIAVAETKKVNRQKVYGKTNHPIFQDAKALTITTDYFLYCPILNVSACVFKRELANRAKTYLNYRLIGDRVFYFEAFQGEKIVLNMTTNSYFRNDGSSVSTLSSKGLAYLVRYYKEHKCFALGALKCEKIEVELYKKYVTRFFNRVNNRLNRWQKTNPAYLNLRLNYMKDLKIKP